MSYDIEFRADGMYAVSRLKCSPSYCEWLMPGTELED